jgi:hypothetical protein
MFKKLALTAALAVLAARSHDRRDLGRARGRGCPDGGIQHDVRRVIEVRPGNTGRNQRWSLPSTDSQNIDGAIAYINTIHKGES